MAELKTPEQIAQDVMDAAFDPEGEGVIDVTEATDDQVYRAIIAAIEADRAQRTYIATVQADGYDPHRVEVTPAKGQSIVEALIEQGDGAIQSEWCLIDVEVR